MPTSKFNSVPFCAKVASFAALIVSTALPGEGQSAAPATEQLPADKNERTSDDLIKLERYSVTGSSLMLPAETSLLTVVDQDAIARAGGATNLLEALRKQVPALTGSGNLGLSNASTSVTSTYGGSRLSLRNSPTLVLLNGRRMATNGANGRGGSSFVDVSQFPLVAIDRVEVLGDGASAVYGSDAIGGVVNVILKPSFNGAEVGGRYAFSTSDGHYSERSAHFVTGVKRGKLGVIALGEYSKSTPLMQDTRKFSSEAFSGSFSGVVGSGLSAYYLHPSVNSPRERVATGPAATAANMAALALAGVYVSGSSTLNLAPDVTTYAGREQSSTYTSVTYKIFDRRLEAFASVLFARANTASQLPAQNTTVTVLDDSPYNPVNANVAQVAIRYQPAPRKYLTLSHEMTATGGLRGEIAPGWTWETAYTKSRSKLVARVANVLYSPNLDLAVRGGYDANGNAVVGGTYSRVYKDYAAPALPATGMTSAQIQAFYLNSLTPENSVIQPAFDPFTRPSAVDPASLANVLGTSRADLVSELATMDFVLRGKFDCLPAGQAELAIGGNYRDEKLSGLPDTNSRNTGLTASRWSGGSFFDPLDQSRFVRSGFAELHLPVASPAQKAFLAHSLAFTFAFRMEDYNESGVSRVPKYNLRWQPLDEQITIRASYGKGFAAPTLYDMYGPTIQGSTANLSAALGYPTGNRQAISRVRSNPDLRPMTSRSESVGLVFLPRFAKGLRVSVDYNDLTISNQVGLVGGPSLIQNVNQLGAASPYAGFVTLNGAPITSVGQIRAFLDGGGAVTQIVIDDMRRNIAGAIVRTVDTSVDYVFPATPIGQFEIGTIGTYFLDDKIQTIAIEPHYEFAGHATSREGTIPGYRFYSHLGLRKAAWDVRVGHSYIPSVDDIGTGGNAYATSTTIRRTKIGSYASWDLGVGYELNLSRTRFFVPEKISLRLGVNNIANRLPPPAPQAFPTTSAAGADVATYGAIGRLYHLSATVKF